MRKLSKLLLPLLVIGMVLPSCQGDPAPVEECEVKTDYYCIMTDDFSTKGEFTYKSQYFRDSPKIFNKDFAMMSYLAATNSGRKDSMIKYYKTIAFKNYHYNDVYVTGCGEDTYGMFIADRVIDDFTVISVSFRSFDYTLEWVSNVTLGKEGNHAGFEYSCNNALEEFNTYVKETYPDTKLKLWINGFSRGGALANMFATKILNDNEFGFTEDNVYCYTFEAPACFSSVNRKDYKCIWNLTNPADVVVNVPPAQYDLYRSGTDVNTYRNDFDTLFHDYMVETLGETKGEEIYEDFPKFGKITDTKNEITFLADFIELLLRNKDPIYGIQNRENFVDHLQPTARLACKILFSITGYQRNYILGSFSYDYLNSNYKLVQLIGNILNGTDVEEEKEDGTIETVHLEGWQVLYNLLEEYLDGAKVDYDKEELKSMCKIVPEFLLTMDIGSAISIATNFQKYRRALYFHWHEASYVLIKNLEYVQEGENA